MKINIAIVAIIVVAILGFVYFVVKKNRRDQKELEQELNEKEITSPKHSKPKV